MAISQPIASDPLNSPDHSLQHRIIASDPAAPVKSLVVGSAGQIGVNKEPGCILDVKPQVQYDGIVVRDFSDDNVAIAIVGGNTRGVFDVYSGGVVKHHFDGAGSVGINQANPGAMLDVNGDIFCKSILSIAPLGTELLLNGTFATDLSNWSYGGGSDWTWDATGKVLHSTGNTTPITQDIAIITASDYVLLITCSGRTAGSFGITLNGVSFYNINTIVFNSNEVFIVTMKSSGTSTQTFSITPTTDFDGKIDDISLKRVTGVCASGLTTKDDSDAVSCQINCDAGLYTTCVGVSAGVKNVTGTGNVFVGSQAGISNVTGNNNVFLGYMAGSYNTGGSNNLFIGTNAGYSNTLGNQNCFFGFNSGYSNTTGYQNLFFGYNAGYSNTTGYYNSFFGSNAGYYTTTGIQNVFFGLNAGLNISTGSNNVCIGVTAGVFQSDGSTAISTPENSIYIGQNVKSGSDPAGGEDDITNEVVIGYDAVGDGANTTTLGNSSTTRNKIFGDIQPGTDNTYYLGKNDDDSPRAYKGIILKDTTDGKYYRIEVISGVVTATDLSD